MNFLGPLPQAHPDYLAGLVAAVLFGALIGVERQWRGHPAGLHTNALVALGSAAYVIVGVLVGDASGPARVVGQVVRLPVRGGHNASGRNRARNQHRGDGVVFRSGRSAGGTRHDPVGFSGHRAHCARERRAPLR